MTVPQVGMMSSPKMWKCMCSFSFDYSLAEHVITEYIDIIQNDDIKSLILKGTNSRKLRFFNIIHDHSLRYTYEKFDSSFFYENEIRKYWFLIDTCIIKQITLLNFILILYTNVLTVIWKRSSSFISFK